MANSNQNLEQLIAEYKTAATKEEQLLLRRLQVIKAHLVDCGEEEFIFADEIVSEFCRIIYKMKEQGEKTAAEAKKSLEDLPGTGKPLSGFVSLYNEGNIPSNLSYATADELLVDFYNAFRNEQKRKTETERKQHPAVERLIELTEPIEVNSTVKDYVARINTFTRRYMGDLPRTMELWTRQTRKIDPVVFAFLNIELILAEFETKNDDGSINKQKSNIQSALRKLNEFKRLKAQKK